MAQDPSTLVNSKIVGVYGCSSKKIWYDSYDMIGFDPDPHAKCTKKTRLPKDHGGTIGFALDV